MAAPKKKKDETTVVAELEVAWGTNSVIVKSFDSAWQLSMDTARQGILPVRQTFRGFVRKDD